ncbi:hypothetical protein [Nocardia sp. No.11]|uniref:hypothetical protein n=1 Tax=Nocardia sp. No.11 TaxID=3128861 RepID=UPI00319E4505
MTRHTDRTTSGETWEAVAGSHEAASAQLDELIKAVTTCECGHAADSLKHYDTTTLIALRRWPADCLAALVAVAVTRLAGMKAGEQP